MKRALALAMLIALPWKAQAAGLQALMVVASTTLTASDQLMFDRLVNQLGFTVTTVQDDLSTAAMATGKDLVLISGSSDSVDVTTKFRTVAVPVWVGEEALFDDMEMSNSGGLGNTNGVTQINVTNGSNYLGAGLSGARTVFSTAAGINYGNPNSNAIIIAEEAGTPSHKVIFGYDTGVMMYSGLSAPARRLAFFPEDLAPQYLSGDGLTLFDQGIRWLIGLDLVTPTLSSTPTWTPVPSNSPTDFPTATPIWIPVPSNSPTDLPTATPTWTPVPSNSPTDLPTATPTWTPLPSDTPTDAPSPSASPSGTHSQTATPIWTSSWTQSPTDIPSPSVTDSPTPSVTASSTPSATASPTSSPAATSTPGLLVQAYVYDSEQRLVKNLGGLSSYAAASNLSASPNPYAPEAGSLTLTAGSLQWLWPGDNAAGLPVPDGQYVLLLKQPGLADLSVHVWVEHKAADFGSLVFFPNPCDGKTLRLSFQAPLPSGAALELYTLAGGRAFSLGLPAGATGARLDLRGPGGQALASGIYIARVRIKGTGGLEQSIVRKLAVLR